ncbi:hypothetical protein [Sphingomonas zeae]
MNVACETLARLMQAMSLAGVIRSKLVRTTVSDSDGKDDMSGGHFAQAARCPPDRINRQFRTPEPIMV